MRAAVWTAALAIIAALTVGVQTPSATSGDVYAVPPHIADDCSADVTQDLLDWIASVPDSTSGGLSVLTFGTSRCYRIDGTLLVQDRWGLAFDGNHSTFRAGTEGDQGRRHWQFRGGGSLTVRDMTVRGANPAGGPTNEAFRADRAFQHGFTLSAVEGALLDRVQVYDTYGDFVFIGGSRNAGPSRNIVVRNSHFERTGRQGIAITHATDVLLSGNHLGEIGRSVFDLEPHHQDLTVRRITIEGNTVGRAQHAWLAAHGRGHDMGDVVVRGNRIAVKRGKPGGVNIRAPHDTTRGPFLFEGNWWDVRGCSKAQFRLERIVDVTIQSNHMEFPHNDCQMAVAYLIDSHRVGIRDNLACRAATVWVEDPDQPASGVVAAGNTLAC